MLKLLIFAPCDKAIIAEGGQTSLIGVLEAVQVGIPKGKPFPPEAMIPYKWNILTLWNREEDVPNPIKCQSRMVLVRPDGVEAMTAEGEFEVSNSFRNFRNHIDLPFLPVGLVGEYSLKLFLKKGEEDWKEITTFPIMIEHRLTEVEIKTEMTITNVEQT